MTDGHHTEDGMVRPEVEEFIRLCGAPPNEWGMADSDAIALCNYILTLEKRLFARRKDVAVTDAMVEAAARALAIHAGENPDKVYPREHWQNFGTVLWNDFAKEARAALTAALSKLETP